MSEQSKLDGRTRRALDMAIARKQVSQESYRAVMRGESTLERAKELGRSRAADTSEASDALGRGASGPRKGRRPRPCIACAGMTKGGRFHPGCDQKLFGELKRNLQNDPLLRNERFSEEQKAYARERGLI